MDRRNLLKILGATSAATLLPKMALAAPEPIIKWIGGTEDHILANDVRALVESTLETGTLRAKREYFDYDIAIKNFRVTVRPGDDFCLKYGYTKEGKGQGLHVFFFEAEGSEAYVIATYNLFAFRGTELGRSLKHHATRGLMLPKVSSDRFDRLIREGKAKANFSWMLKEMNANKASKMASRSDQQVSVMASAYSRIPKQPLTRALQTITGLTA